MMSPWGWTQIKGSKHVGQCYTINVIKLYILSDYKYRDKMYGMNSIKCLNNHSAVIHILHKWS